MTVPAGTHADQIGIIGLKDPTGTMHTGRSFNGKVVVAIFSAPNSGQGDQQKKWSKLLADQADTKVPPKVGLILVEDMTQAGAFKGIAQGKMKDEFKPGSRPLLLLDQKGDVTTKFGVPKDKTEIIIYDKHGKLRDVETDLDSQAVTVQRIKTITSKLLANS